MKKNKFSMTFLKAPFPAIMTIISFLLFIVIYWVVTKTVTEPYYLRGLMFAVPFLCFGIVLYLAVKGKIKNVTASITTGILIIFLGFAMFIAFSYIAIDTATTVTTDVNKYEKAIELSNFPDHLLENCFPDKIPDNAKNIKFSYNPAFMQGGEDIALKFKTDSDSIKRYIEDFSSKAIWVGKADESEANNYGIFYGTFNILDYKDTGLPNDYTIYVICSKPYRLNDWNHGERSLVAISEQNNEILFLANDW